MLQNVFQSFFVAAGKPQLGLKVIVAAGCTNIVLDALFIGVLHFGIAGAAFATMTSEFIGGLLPVVYFFRKNDSLLHFVKPVFDRRVFLKTCTNGSSELMTNLSMSLVNALYNLQLMKIAGENGVAALWCSYVRQFYLCCHLFRLCNWLCPGYQLPLWCWKSRRA